MKYEKELSTGQYYDLLARGFLNAEEANEPSIEGFEFYMDAFIELGTCRPSGLDLQPIPFSVFVDYAYVYNLEREDLEDLIIIVRRLDDVFLKWMANKKEAKNAAKPDKNNNDKRKRG